MDKIDDLFIIVGTSPLPNYIVLSHFIKPHKEIKRIHLLCSKGNSGYSSTLNYAKKLKYLFGQDELKNDTKPQIEVYEIENILYKNKTENMVTQILDKNKGTFEHIHLNYTGGTKSLAVYCYDVLKDYAQNNHYKFSSSYLDAKTNKLYIDGTDNEDISLHKENIDLERLAAIHLYDITQMYIIDKNDVNNDEKDISDIIKYDEINLIKIVDKINNNNNLLENQQNIYSYIVKQLPNIEGNYKSEKLDKLCDTLNFEVIFPNDDKIISNKKNYVNYLVQYLKRQLFLERNPEILKNLEEMNNNQTLDPQTTELINLILQNLCIITQKKISNLVQECFKMYPDDLKFYDGEIKQESINKNKSERIKIFNDYVRSKWFEDYLFVFLVNLVNKINYEKKCNINIYRNVVLKKENQQNVKNKEFEIDYILQHKFDIIGISATTAKASYLVKSKGFEIIYRTQQFSGDEAKAILISFANDDNKEKIENELQKDLGGAFKYFKHFNHTIFDDDKELKEEIIKLLKIN